MTTPTLPMTDPGSGAGFLSAFFGGIFGGGFTEVAEEAYQAWLRGTPIEQVLETIRSSEPYKARFPGMTALRAAGRPISEAAYLDIERQFTQVARQFDLPPGFYDEPADFGRLIGGEVSPSEWQRRLTTWQAYERETRDPVAAAEVARQFQAAGLGVPSDGDFLAAVIDPTKGIAAIERRLEAARIGTESVRAGFGALSVDESLSLADQGVTREQATSGFGALAESRELFSGLAGEVGADTLGRGEQIGAAFGTDAAARRRLERQARRRAGEFGGTASAGITRGGLTGLGA